MPRIPTSLLRKAYAIDPLLPRLLPPCRDLRAAQNELRWLREHVDDVAQARSAKGGPFSKSAFLRDLVQQRARGRPLQYLLGTEYFGDLEISCRPGVLIPRQDTAISVQCLVRSVRDAQNLPSELRVLDLCTGTGCIPLLFHHEFCATRDDIDLRALGIDISKKALQLAVHNHKRVRRNRGWAEKGSIAYIRADVLANPFADVVRSRLPVSTALRYAKLPHLWDILISNPPYISPSGYWKTTTRSVRGFEPKLALVPPPKASNDDAQQGDAFYQPILNIASEVEAKIVLLEVADLDQALRVARAAKGLRIFDGVEIWREQPDEPHDPSSETAEFPVLGEGNARSVICWRGTGAAWLGKSERASTYKDVAAPDVSLDARFRLDPMGLPQGDQLRPHWVKQLTEQQRAEKHNVWRDVENLQHQNVRESAGDESAGEAGKTGPGTTAGSQNTHEGGSSKTKLANHAQKRISKALVESGNQLTDSQRREETHADHSMSAQETNKRLSRSKPLNKEQQERLLQYYRAGRKITAIARELECTRSTVYNYLHRWSIFQAQKVPLTEEQRIDR
ncbi:uncharacterized protein N0V89_009445 [Didymosphaeria variabile]|uniref:Resolvase HTH domain-containing protein n=1 Tax=Didymosphaeria variabile TaxID=1932322 RepID=A0A9W9C799_9PLEO|nr:uncharacterized protein N0V89_009445 [Didymosphaeria variabile]KAJ4348073.1 hypothetical protein N0V89_009445 [Didymosphaeria variabile]